MKELGVGVLGLGRLGYVHAFNLARVVKNAKLVAVCDMQEDVLTETKDELGCLGYTDFNKMLENKDIDAVVITTPTAYHVDPVTAAAQAGKAVFCEKPLASTMEDNLKLQSIIKETGVKCQIGFNRRFDPAFVEAKKLIMDGAIGKPCYFYGVSRDPFPPPAWACDPSKGGGLFIDMLLHDFDISRFLMGDDVKSVFADEANLVVDSMGINRFSDNVTANLHFKSGALANCHGSMHAIYGYDVRAEVYGEKGNLFIGGLNKTEITLCTHEKGISKPVVFEGERKMPHFMLRFKESYENEIKEFVDVVVNNKTPLATEDDAVAAFKISMASIKSAGEKIKVDIE